MFLYNMMRVYPAFVLRPSYVPEKVRVNQERYFHQSVRLKEVPLNQTRGVRRRMR